MWICERCETYNQDNQLQCRICGADKPEPVSAGNNGSQETQVSYVQPNQTISVPSSAQKPEVKPTIKITPSVPAETVKSKTERHSSPPSAKILKSAEIENEREERKREAAKKRRKKRIVLAVVNGVLFVVNIVTVIFIVR